MLHFAASIARLTLSAIEIEKTKDRGFEDRASREPRDACGAPKPDDNQTAQQVLDELRALVPNDLP